MADLEQQLSQGLKDEVGDWRPRPGPVPRASAVVRHRGVAAVAVVALLVLVAGGVTAGLRRGGDGTTRLAVGEATEAPVPSAAAASVVASATAATCPAPSQPAAGADVPGCVAEGAADAGSAVAAGSAGLPASPATTESALAAPILPSATVPAARAGVAAGGASGSVAKTTPTCRAADFAVTIATDEPSYAQAESITMTVTVKAKKACSGPSSALVGEVREGGTDGPVVESFGSGCPMHDGQAESCTTNTAAAAPVKAPATLRSWKKGETDSASDTWNQVVKAGAPAAYSQAAMTVVVTDGAATGSKPLIITPAPDCTGADLTGSLTADAQTYAQGQIAHLTGTLTNTSQQPCNAVPMDTAPVATDAQGNVVWQCGDPSGSPKGQDYAAGCPSAAIALSPQLVLPGQPVYFWKGQETYATPDTWTWDLVRDGTQTTDPAPVPAGTYTLSWTGLLHAPSAAATTTVTVTG